MSIVFRDFGTTYLAAPLAANSTSLTVDNAAWLPSLSNGDYFYLVLQDFGNRANVEIVKCTATNGNVLTIVRAQSGTAARPFLTGDYAELRLTTDALTEYIGQNIAGKMDKSGGGDFAGIYRFLNPSTSRIDLVRTSDNVAGALAIDYSATEGHRTLIGGVTGSNAVTPSIVLRPNGYGSGTGQLKIDSTGNVDAWHIALRSAQKTDPGAVVRYDTLANYVPKTRAINAHALDADFSITAAEVFSAGAVVDANARFRATDFQYTLADGSYGVRLAVSTGIAYLQGGKTDSTLAEQKLYLTGWMGNPLAALKIYADADLIHRKSAVDYKIYSEANKPTAADVAALPLAGGTLLGALIVANIKSAIKVDNQKSISYQDAGNAMFHHMAAGNYFQINTGVNGTVPLWNLSNNGDVVQGSTLNLVDGNSRVLRSSSGLVRVSGSSNAFMDGGTGAYISSNLYHTGSGWGKWTLGSVGGLLGLDSGNLAYSVAAAGSLSTVVRFLVSDVGAVFANNLVNRAWNGYGSAAYSCAELSGSAGVLRAALSYPFKIVGNYAVDCYLATYSATSSASDLFHILGFTDGTNYNPGWRFGAGGALMYNSSSVTGAVGTITSNSPMTAPSFTPTSDARLKPEEKRAAIKDATEFLRKLNPMYYFKKYAIESEQGFYEFGFVADDVEKHEPRLVFQTKDEHRLKHLAMNGIVAHLAKGFQEIDARLSRIEQALGV